MDTYDDEDDEEEKSGEGNSGGGGANKNYPYRSPLITPTGTAKRKLSSN
jgi:hypothetical protein